MKVEELDGLLSFSPCIGRLGVGLFLSLLG